MHRRQHMKSRSTETALWQCRHCRWSRCLRRTGIPVNEATADPQRRNHHSRRNNQTTYRARDDSSKKGFALLVMDEFATYRYSTTTTLKVLMPLLSALVGQAPME